MVISVMLVRNAADSFSVNLAAWLPKLSELGTDLLVTDQAEEIDLISREAVSFPATTVVTVEFVSKRAGL
jgi:hypothetical protein